MKVIFMGTPDFAKEILSGIYAAGHEIVLVVTQPDRQKGRGKKMQCCDVKEWALTHDLPVFSPTRIKDKDAMEELKKYPADIAVVAAFGQILPKEVLEHPRLGCVNVHASLLPKYRGAAPIQWAILNGDEKTGVTIMQMGVGLDDGDILSSTEVIIDKKETGGSLFDKLATTGSDLLVHTLDELEQGKIIPRQQCEEQATHVGRIHKELGRLDFTKSAIELERYIRGLNPWPSAYTTYQGKTLKIWDADVEAADTKEEPGTICFLDDKIMKVATGDGLLIVSSVQLEGKKRMRMEEFLRGKKLSVGEKLG